MQDNGAWVIGCRIISLGYWVQDNGAWVIGCRIMEFGIMELGLLGAG